jgi:hypothetical protein
VTVLELRVPTERIFRPQTAQSSLPIASVIGVQVVASDHQFAAQILDLPEQPDDLAQHVADQAVALESLMPSHTSRTMSRPSGLLGVAVLTDSTIRASMAQRPPLNADPAS